MYNVGDGLGVGGGFGLVVLDCVVYFGEFVGYMVGNVCVSCCVGIGFEDNVVFECDCYIVIVWMLGGVFVWEWLFG